MYMSKRVKQCMAGAAFVAALIFAPLWVVKVLVGASLLLLIFMFLAIIHYGGR